MSDEWEGYDVDDWEMAEGKASPETMKRLGVEPPPRFDGRIDEDTYVWTGQNGGAMETFLGPWFNSIIPTGEWLELNVGRGGHVRYETGVKFHIVRKDANGLNRDYLEVIRDVMIGNERARTFEQAEQVEQYGDPNYVDFVTNWHTEHTLPSAPLTAAGRDWAQTEWQKARANEDRLAATDSGPAEGEAGVQIGRMVARAAAAYADDGCPSADSDGPWAWEGAGRLTPETEAVWAEYSRAKAKHGDHVIDGPVYSDAERYVVLMEEVGEVAHELTYDADTDPDIHDQKLYEELIQVGTMALGFAKAVRERRERRD